jgi:hypothetical protein
LKGLLYSEGISCAWCHHDRQIGQRPKDPVCQGPLQLDSPHSAIVVLNRWLEFAWETPRIPSRAKTLTRADLPSPIARSIPPPWLPCSLHARQRSSRRVGSSLQPSPTLSECLVDQLTRSDRIHSWPASSPLNPSLPLWIPLSPDPAFIRILFSLICTECRQIMVKLSSDTVHQKEYGAHRRKASHTCSECSYCQVKEPWRILVKFIN